MLSPNWSQVVLPEDWEHGGFGLYIHWPFCQAKCPYCDFNSHVVSNINQSEWQNAYLSEIRRVGAETKDRVLRSVFFGGGTPSMMDADLVDAIITQIRATWPLANDIEITLEANPTSVEAGRFRGYREAGVNRISLGIQALNDPDLKALGRLHTTKEAMAAFDVARNAFERVSFDLIYARQGQSVKAWEKELTTALGLAIDHLSLYQLTIETGTAFGDRYAAGKLRGLPNDDLAADMYDLTQSVCENTGFPSYEVSNHSKPGSESIHNKIYWQYGDYVGIGPGAHGRVTLNNQRYATETPLGPTAWLHRVNRTGNGELGRTHLSAEDQLSEFMLMGLRLREGINLKRIDQSRYCTLSNNINKLVDMGMLSIAGTQLCLTPKGRPLLNAVLRELLGG